MSDQTPFEINPYAPTEERLPEDILREIPPEDPRTPMEQLIENARIKVSTTEVSVTSHCEF